MLFGMSWKANSSIEKSQNLLLVAEQWTAFFEYLFPRLLPNYKMVSQKEGIEKGLTYPDVVSKLHQVKCKTALRICNTDPYFAVHEETVMKIYDWLLYASFRRVDSSVLLTLPPADAM